MSEVMAWTVTDPYSGDRFWVTEEERTVALDKYAKKQKEPTRDLVADAWWLAYWGAEKRGHGVVWEGTGVFALHGTIPTLYLNGSADGLESGGYYTVTVTKEE